MDISTLEYDGQNYIFDLETDSPNLFYVGNMQLMDANFSTTQQKVASFSNSTFRIIKVAIPGLKLQWQEIGAGQRYPSLQGIGLSTEVKVTWIEDAYKSVDMFHRSWLNYWFSREKMRFKVGAENKFMQLDVHPFKYINDNNDKDAYNNFTIQTLYNIQLKGLAPTELNDLKFDYTSNGEPTVEYSYKLFKGTITAEKISPDKLWDPTSIVNDGSESGNSLPKETDKLKALFESGKLTYWI
jgi:hypothetical protein